MKKPDSGIIRNHSGNRACEGREHDMSVRIGLGQPFYHASGQYQAPRLFMIWICKDAPALVPLERASETPSCCTMVEEQPDLLLHQAGFLNTRTEPSASRSSETFSDVVAFAIALLTAAFCAAVALATRAQV
jgi:hypothetical protein